MVIVLLLNAQDKMLEHDLHGTITVLKAYQAQRIASEFAELRLGAGSQCGDSFTLVASPGDVAVSRAGGGSAGEADTLHHVIGSVTQIVNDASASVMSVVSGLSGWLGYPVEAPAAGPCS